MYGIFQPFHSCYLLIVRTSETWISRKGEFPPVSTVFFFYGKGTRLNKQSRFELNFSSSKLVTSDRIVRRCWTFYEHFFPVLVNFPDTCFLEISDYLRLFNRFRDYPRWRDDSYLKKISSNNVSFVRVESFYKEIPFFPFLFLFFFKSLLDNVNETTSRKGS